MIVRWPEMWLQMNSNTIEYVSKQLIVSLLNFLRWLFYISNDNLRLRPILKASTICFFPGRCRHHDTLQPQWPEQQSHVNLPMEWCRKLDDKTLQEALLWVTFCKKFLPKINFNGIMCVKCGCGVFHDWDSDLGLRLQSNRCWYWFARPSHGHIFRLDLLPGLKLFCYSKCHYHMLFVFLVTLRVWN